MLPAALEYPSGIEMVFECTVPAREGRSCEHFGGYRTINRIPLPVLLFCRLAVLHTPIMNGLEGLIRCKP